jgi:hypothetical protein
LVIDGQCWLNQEEREIAMKPRFGKRLPAAIMKRADAQPPVAPGADQEAIAPRVDANQSVVNEDHRVAVQDVIDIATQAWRARSKMIDPASGESREEMKRVFRHVEAILSSLSAMGFELKDHTGDGFDYGLPLRVVGTQPTAGLTRDTVIETLKPTIYWKNRIVQSGEVIVGTPVEQ